jgi:hypothetical protein
VGCRTLADADHDNALSLEEFVVALFLADKAKTGYQVPPQVPEALRISARGMVGVGVGGGPVGVPQVRRQERARASRMHTYRYPHAGTGTPTHKHTLTHAHTHALGCA